MRQILIYLLQCWISITNLWTSITQWTGLNLAVSHAIINISANKYYPVNGLDLAMSQAIISISFNKYYPVN